MLESQPIHHQWQHFRIVDAATGLVEWEYDHVLVGHNLRFDTSFLDAALTAHGYDRLRHTRVDTVALARRLVRDEVPNLRLATLARYCPAT